MLRSRLERVRASAPRARSGTHRRPAEASRRWIHTARFEGTLPNAGPRRRLRLAMSSCAFAGLIGKQRGRKRAQRSWVWTSRVEGRQVAMGQGDLTRLTDGFAGEVVRPDDPGYDAARAVWNSMIDRRPALIVRPTGNDDVVAALRFAREQELIVAIRCGGHSIPGFSTCDDGIVIDLSRMRGAEVDPETRTARVRGGSLLAELDDAAQAHGLVCPVGVVSHTGRRRPHARRRDGPAAAPARPDDRQPARGRARDRGRPGRTGKRRREPGALLGHARGRRELRHRDVVRVPPASASKGR